MADTDLVALATREIEQIGLGMAGDVAEACVIRQRKAYPVYDDAYAKHVNTVREALEQHCENIHLIGRNGMHKYNNQDHANDDRDADGDAVSSPARTNSTFGK